MPIALMLACTNVHGGCFTMDCRDFFVQPYQFDPESDPEGESPEKNTDSAAAAGRFRMVSVSE